MWHLTACKISYSLLQARIQGWAKVAHAPPPSPPEATASHTLPPVFFDITLLCISYPDTCDLQKTDFINDNERAISKWHAVICQ